MAPALSTIASDLNMNKTEAVMALSVYLLATAFGPLLIAPLSEIYGRRPVLHTTNIWFLVWNLVCGFANNKGVLIASRLLAGLGASAIYVLANGVLGDVWRPEQRGISLGIYSLVPLLGAAVGPIVGGFITEYTSWRWMFWSTSALQAVMIVVSLFIFDETYAPVRQRKRQRKLDKQSQSSNDEGHPEPATTLSAPSEAQLSLLHNLTRPLRTLLSEPIIQIQACLSASNYGILYLVLSTFSDLYTSQYHERISISGLHYLAMTAGEIAGAQIAGRAMDILYRRRKARDQTPSPEQRILVMIPGAILGPIGMFTYGWAAESHTHWAVVDVGAMILNVGMTISGVAITAYMIDAYPLHVGSASAASQFLKSLTAFGFPLFAPSMYSDGALGYGWGNTLLGVLMVCVSGPAAVLIWRFGRGMRERSGWSA
ncbi:hypothetical protein OHC33_010999 [Knufia fluminis]|uniref:Major facilitator superfamily (MFS) profile domain-containing protein n=1 Tax=Knufia fluminis TaxID=191047 RepID=A0AAN8E8F7_9EURO|nr:hypothetical protein OHC33_010999 [Knufia fluminis]